MAVDGKFDEMTVTDDKAQFILPKVSFSDCGTVFTFSIRDETRGSRFISNLIAFPNVETVFQLMVCAFSH